MYYKLIFNWIVAHIIWEESIVALVKNTWNYHIFLHERINEKGLLQDPLFGSDFTYRLYKQFTT